MLFISCEVPTDHGKIFCRGLKNGPRPKVKRRFKFVTRTKYFLVLAGLNGK